MPTIKSPYPWFGGKAAVTAEIWRRFGDVAAFVDPFLGSAATVLGRPDYDPSRHKEVVNDLDGMLVNFWRAVQHDPEQVAFHADHWIAESDMHARHAWLVGQKPSIVSKLEGDPDYYEPKAAGWWVWGQSIWLGWGWCSGKGPWHVVDGELVRIPKQGGGVVRQMPAVGITHKTDGHGIHRKGQDLIPYMLQLAERFRKVRVLCGDWSRLLVPAIVEGLNERLPKPQTTGIVLDPPYLAHDREANVYAHDSADVANEVYEWAVKHGDNPSLRIALCGYEGHFDMPASWSVYRWKTQGGYANLGDGQGRANKGRECIWFSPACLTGDGAPQQTSFF